MKVSDLLTKLKLLPPNADVLCYTEDENFQDKGQMFRIFEIDDIYISEATKVRTSGGQASLKLGKSENSEPHVLISVISDF
jgi:hypothetical protein